MQLVQVQTHFSPKCLRDNNKKMLQGGNQLKSFIGLELLCKRIETFKFEFWGAAIAQWIRLRLPSCRPGFESQAHHLRFHEFIELCNVGKTKINKKRPGLAHFLKNI